MENLNKINSIKTQSELNEYKAKINEAFEKRAEFISLCEVANKASQKSFGYIKEAFENISPVLFNVKGGRKMINKYISTIKENKNLSTLHTLFENIRKVNGDTDVDYFVNNTIAANWDLDKNTLNEDINKIGKILAEGILTIGKDAIDLINIDENTKLNNALIFIAENKQNNKNINKYSDATKVIREHIVNNPKTNVFEKVDLDAYANNLLESFNKKYTSDLTEDDWKILKEVDLKGDKEQLFNSFKENCLSKLTEMKEKYNQEGNNEDSQRLSSVIEKINKKSFVAENITTDICGFAEITKIFG